MALNAYVLDDELQVGKVVCQMLVATGFLPRQFTAPDPFMTAILESSPDLIVLDLSLGQSDAIEIMRQLELARYPRKLLLISGHDEKTLAEVTDIGRRRGLMMLEPLMKPFRLSDLKNRLAIPNGCSPDMITISQTIDVPPKVTVDLGDALSNRWLELWYQPKINLASLSVCGAEALLRGRHPVHGILSPAELLPPAGDALYGPLSKFVVDQAMTDWNFFFNQNGPIKLAVNIPVSVLVAPEFIRTIREALPNNPSFPGLIIELTEDEIIRDADAIREAATQLTLYNIRLSIDDFGTAYSSLARLRELPFSELKLDRSFVSNLASDGSKRSLCLAAIDLAHDFGASICAEGVESADDLRVLIEMRCDTAQGFLFAKPMPFDQFSKMMQMPAAQKPFALTA